MRSGDAMATSKSRKPPCTRSTRSSAPTTSAPACRASSAAGPVANTATRTVLPVPLADRRHHFAARRLRGPLEPGRRAQEHRRRGRLGDERERTVLEDGDLDGDDRAPLALRLGVVHLAEVHDVHAVRAQRRAHRGRWRGVAGGNLDLHDGRDALFGHQSFATWLKSSSTGVSRPKMLTRTLSFIWSSLISAICPEKSANGPSRTRTVSPGSYSRRGRVFFGPSMPSGLTCRMLSTSLRESGVGLAPEPTKPVTPGVLRMTYQESSSSTQRTSR